MFQEWLKLWELQNVATQGRELSSQTRAAERQTLRELIQLHAEHQNQVGQTLRWLFDIPLATCQECQMSAMRQWLKTWKPVIEESYKTALETG